MRSEKSNVHVRFKCLAIIILNAVVFTNNDCKVLNIYTIICREVSHNINIIKLKIKHKSCRNNAEPNIKSYKKVHQYDIFQ